MRILIYDDAPTFGGHEVLLGEAARQLAGYAQIEVSFMFFQDNLRMVEMLTRLVNSGVTIALCPLSFGSKNLQSIRTLTARKKIRTIQQKFEQMRPDVILCAQGTIEISSMGVLAGKKGGFVVVSYIPFAHSMSVMGMRLAPLREAVSKCFYLKPDAFITSSEGAKEVLVSRGIAEGRISIALNGVDLDRLKLGNREEVRGEYHLTSEAFVVALAGRIVFSHKGHDLLVKAICELRDDFERFTFLIIGDGPDRSRLQSLIRKRGLLEKIRIIPWSDDVSKIYSGIDMLVIPSRFEGVPMVMQEAMYFGIPIVAFRIAGIAEFLPSNWLADPYDPGSLAKTILRVAAEDNHEIIKHNKELVCREFSPEKFGRTFYRTLMKYAT